MQPTHPILRVRSNNPQPALEVADVMAKRRVEGAVYPHLQSMDLTNIVWQYLRNFVNPLFSLSPDSTLECNCSTPLQEGRLVISGQNALFASPAELLYEKRAQLRAKMVSKPAIDVYPCFGEILLQANMETSNQTSFQNYDDLNQRLYVADNSGTVFIATEFLNNGFQSYPTGIKHINFCWGLDANTLLVISGRGDPPSPPSRIALWNHTTKKVVNERICEDDTMQFHSAFISSFRNEVIVAVGKKYGNIANVKAFTLNDLRCTGTWRPSLHISGQENPEVRLGQVGADAFCISGANFIEVQSLSTLGNVRFDFRNRNSKAKFCMVREPIFYNEQMFLLVLSNQISQVTGHSYDLTQSSSSSAKK